MSKLAERLMIAISLSEGAGMPVTATVKNEAAMLDKAIDAIEAALDAERWVSVEKRLPTVFEDVIVINVYGRIDVGYWGGKYWFQRREHPDYTVTHWRPLPKFEVG